MSEPVPFPVPDFDGPTVVFGAPPSAYLTREQLPDGFYSGRGRHCEVASNLFFRGGKLADHGLQFKPGIDRAKAAAAIRGLLSSFAPKHEIKIGTVGYALSQWCEDYTPEPTPHQAQRKKPPHKGKRSHRIRRAG